MTGRTVLPVSCVRSLTLTNDVIVCAQVLDLMAKDLEHMGQMTCEVKKARWGRILDALRLSRPQQDALLLLRKQHLKKLHDVYEQRQRLNMQVRYRPLVLGPPAGSDECIALCSLGAHDPIII